MNRVNAFIELLDEWKDESEVSSSYFQGILFNLSYQLGTDASHNVSNTSELKERILYLINEVKLKEKFIVNSLILEVNNFFEHDIRNHGNAIVTNESIIDNYVKEFGENPPHLGDTLERLKENGYRFKLETQYDLWKFLTLKTFNYASEKEWERLEHIEMKSELEKQFSGLSEEEMNLTLGELRDKIENGSK
ncbi:hypothetical protein [Metabacillus sp. 22489]|uniref:hypothetical protein n=1 Tax=Metabacillus sp. 22489 TaxID=3453928 RepID=UPI003F85A0E8